MRLIDADGALCEGTPLSTCGAQIRKMVLRI